MESKPVPEEKKTPQGGDLFSQSWSVLSPSFPVCSASVPSFRHLCSRITLSKYKRWGEIEDMVPGSLPARFGKIKRFLTKKINFFEKNRWYDIVVK
jgi:hypothetical protein